MDYAKVINNVPQTRPLPNYPDMIKNNAGGYGFEITPQQLLERFLLIGSEGGTYYVGEQKLTEDNAKRIIAYIKTNGMEVLATVNNFIEFNRAPKIDPSLFVLALLATHGDEVTKKYTYNSIERNCKTATHLFIFVSQVNELRGWSAGLRRGIAKWYTSKTDNQLAYQLVKYRERAGFTHRDILRLCHPKALTESQNNLFKYAVGKISSSLENEKLPFIIRAFELSKGNANLSQIRTSITDANLTWEMIPTQFLNDPSVLTALLQKMPTTAMIRNLNRFAKADMTTGLTHTTKLVTSKLNKEAIKNSGIHPVNLINSMRTYASGRGDKGSSSWSVNQNIVDALNESYYHAIENVTPSGKTILVALDVSYSMNTPVTRTNMTATQLGCVLAVTLAKTEPLVDVIGFDTGVQNIPVGRRTSIEEACRATCSGGGTDCSVPFAYALHNKVKYDAIVILTDSETWAGKTHGVTLLEAYRKTLNKDVKVIEVAMTGTEHSTMPTNDKNLLRVVGFDSTVVSIINEYLK